jgi:hypothetical protein
MGGVLVSSTVWATFEQYKIPLKTAQQAVLAGGNPNSSVLSYLGYQLKKLGLPNGIIRDHMRSTKTMKIPAQAGRCGVAGLAIFETVVAWKCAFGCMK